MAVAERDGSGELAADRGDRGEDPFGARLREHLTEFLGLLADLAQPAAAPELDEHALGAERDQRARGADEQTPGPRPGRGHVGEFRPTGI